jgi:hypothetical protein
MDAIPETMRALLPLALLVGIIVGLYMYGRKL